MLKFTIALSGLFMSLVAFAQSPAQFALQTDGFDDFAHPLTPNAAGLDSGTVELWFAANNWLTEIQIWGGGVGFPGTNTDNTRIGNNGSVGGSQIAFGQFPAPPWRWAASGIRPASGTWYHVVATWADDGMKIYLNGQLTGESTYNAAMFNYTQELIGTSSWGDFFGGSIDEIRIWDFALDSAQISKVSLDTLGAEYYSTTDSGLVAYYRMDVFEDLGINGDGADDIRDFSVNGNHLDTGGDPVLAPSGAFVVTSIGDVASAVPEEFHLRQNYPNPFNPVTNVEFGIRNSELVSLTIYDLSGREVRNLVNNRLEAGMHIVVWDGMDNLGESVTSGMYFYRLQAGNFVAAKKMLLVR